MRSGPSFQLFWVVEFLVDAKMTDSTMALINLDAVEVDMVTSSGHVGNFSRSFVLTRAVAGSPVTGLAPSPS